MDLFNNFRHRLEGEFYTDNLHKILYSTDASVYRILPDAVAIPKNENDIQIISEFASKNGIAITPRAAGTSLAGQCVNTGIIIDTSKYLNNILEINKNEKWVRVQPGVVRDELNKNLKPYNLFFSPNTSTTNRCTIGGMVANNSSGSTSIAYGVTRDKIIEVRGVLSSGDIVVFNNKDLSFIEDNNQLSLQYRVFSLLQNYKLRKEIENNFPDINVHRRNTGYALDALIRQSPWNETGGKYNLSKLICGSEGTLMTITEFIIQLDALPPKEVSMLAIHFESIQEALRSTTILMKEKLYACELIDKFVLDCTKRNRKYKNHRCFLQGNPEAVLLVECRNESKEKLKKQVNLIITILQSENLGYAYPVLIGKKIDMAIELRSAGLGLLGNLKGDKKAVACVEDTAVPIANLPEYIKEFSQIMNSFKQSSVYYAHAGAGELHLRPILNLKKKEEVKDFRQISERVAKLVKKYRGSLSGEHGDGIVRSEFIEHQYTKNIIRAFEKIKTIFDPKCILNPGKIVYPYEMDQRLRYAPDRNEPEIDTFFDFSDDFGILRSAEKCNGSGDCIIKSNFGGIMCPSFMATRDEKDSTRGRANVLREVLTKNNAKNKFFSNDLFEAMKLCISCKGCVTECPSGVDMARMKSEFLYQFQKVNGVSFQGLIFAYSFRFYSFFISRFSMISSIIQNKLISYLIKILLGVSKNRELPHFSAFSLSHWLKKQHKPKTINGALYLFVDEFTQYLDTKTGRDTCHLLNSLGFKIYILSHLESGRLAISKGMLEYARKCADYNVKLFKDVISDKIPLVGVEPSAILSFRDEYPRLVSKGLRGEAKKLANNVYTLEEFLVRMIEKEKMTIDSFDDKKRSIKVHIHCHQKALSGTIDTLKVLNFPKNHKASIIPSGCCGMAGSFGYEKKNYNLSMKIGELVLFPHIRNAVEEEIIVASGLSCRQQILDGTNKNSIHPATLLCMALKN